MEIKNCDCPVCGSNVWRPQGVYMKCSGCDKVERTTPQEVRGYWKFHALVEEIQKDVKAKLEKELAKAEKDAAKKDEEPEKATVASKIAEAKKAASSKG